jgi:hypothetical protein
LDDEDIVPNRSEALEGDLPGAVL